MRKLILEDFEEDIDYALIGIHCAIEDYRLVYLLNQKLELHFKRKTEDLCYSNEFKYPIFEWEDSKQLTVWNLIANKSEKEIMVSTNEISLFMVPEKQIKTKFLIPEFKKVNFILKISNDCFKTLEKQVLNKILSISQITMAYSIDTSKIKNTESLIFN
ncbi:MAG: IPExxxVDY family protein [Oceanihabitans sp.]